MCACVIPHHRRTSFEHVQKHVDVLGIDLKHSPKVSSFFVCVDFKDGSIFVCLFLVASSFEDRKKEATDFLFFREGGGMCM